MNATRTCLAPLLLFLFAGIAAAAPFQPGNIVVYRVGPSGALDPNGNAVFLDEYHPAGFVVQSIPLPASGSGLQKALVASGSAVGDGFLTRSSSGNCLAVPGYARNLGAGAGNLISGSLDGVTPIPRSVARVMASGVIDSSTALTDAAPGSNIRGATSTNCNDFWVSGGSGGPRHATLGATTSDDLSSSFANLRTIAVFGSQLYAGLSVTAIRGPATVGTGTPLTGPQTVTGFSGLNITNVPNGHAFFLADLDAGVPGMDTLYIADEVAGLLKFSLVGGTWISRGTVGADADDYRGVTGVVSGTTVTLYATRGALGLPGGGQLVRIVDSSGYAGILTAAPVVLATAAPNTTYRGVALAPEVTVTPIGAPHGTILPADPLVVAGGTSVQLSITPDPGYSVIVGGTCGGSLSGTIFITSPVSVNCSVAPTFVLIPSYTVTPIPSMGGSMAPSEPQTVVQGQTIAFTITPDPGWLISTVSSSCGGTRLGNVFTTNPIFADCSVIAIFATLPTFSVIPAGAPHGTMDPNVPQTVLQGETVAFTLTPDPDYFVLSVLSTPCGGTLVGNVFTTGPVNGTCVVLPTFAPLPVYNVTPTATPHGAIDPSIAQLVISGHTATFTVTAEPGYTAVVRGTCGGTLVGATYTTNAITANCTVAVTFSKKLVLFVGNSYTFGRVDPVMSYNTANVTDLTYQMWLSNPFESNPDEPHPWGGIPGVFKKFTDQAGLDFDVSISARNAASLRGHYLNTNPAGWDLRGNVASQKWDVVVLQDLSDEPLPAGKSANANLPYFNAYADKFEAWVHLGAAETYTESQLFGGSTATCMAITGGTSGACNTVRTIAPANANARAATDVYLYSTWARPDMIGPNGTKPSPGSPYYSAEEGLEAMTLDLHNAYFGRAAANANIKAVNPVGDAFLLAVQTAVAMRDPYVPEPGKINLWHTDFFHPSKYGSYLSALVHFAMITGIDPTTLGAGELAAIDLGISTSDAVALQQVAKATVVPAEPAVTAVTRGNAQVTVSFTAPSNVGGLAITGYLVACAGEYATGPTSPITVMGLANGVAVTCAVAASNSVGTGGYSAASSAVTPATVPDAPEITSLTLAGAGALSVAFNAPASDGGSTITSYTATCVSSLNIPSSTTGPASPLVVSDIVGWTDVAYCRVRATNTVGDGPDSPVFAGPPQFFVLTTTVSGTGSGTITSVPAGIACPGDCSEGYFSGTGVELTAAPSAGSVFTGWSGDCAGTGTCNVTMSAARNVAANFNIAPDTTPDPFAFSSRTRANRSALLTSNTIMVSGIAAPAAISVTNGFYSIGCAGAGTQAPATIANGQTVCVQHISSPFALAPTTTTLTIGGVSATFTSTTRPATRGDANADGKADLFWRDVAGLSIWYMDGAAVPVTSYYGLAPEWELNDVGDVNGAGRADIVWRRWITDGAINLWMTDDIVPGAVSSFDLGTLHRSLWTLVGLADFDGDGRADFLWSHLDGTLYTWLTNGPTIIQQGAIGNPGQRWAVIDMTDMNGDGKADIVFRNLLTGQVYIWFMDGLSVTSSGSPGTLDPAVWNLVAAADFDDDGKGDLLWRSYAGDTWVWLMDGTTFRSGASIGNPGLAWSIKSVADFDGDGKADLMWRHTDGTTYFWKMNGSSLVSATPVTNPGGTWYIVAP